MPPPQTIRSHPPVGLISFPPRTNAAGFPLDQLIARLLRLGANRQRSPLEESERVIHLSRMDSTSRSVSGPRSVRASSALVRGTPSVCLISHRPCTVASSAGSGWNRALGTLPAACHQPPRRRSVYERLPSDTPGAAPFDEPRRIRVRAFRTAHRNAA